jgi:hypothetical protein
LKKEPERSSRCREIATVLGTTVGELDAQVDFVLRAVKSAERPHLIPAKRAKRKKK